MRDFIISKFNLNDYDKYEFPPGLVLLSDEDENHIDAIANINPNPIIIFRNVEINNISSKFYMMPIGYRCAMGIHDLDYQNHYSNIKDLANGFSKDFNQNVIFLCHDDEHNKMFYCIYENIHILYDLEKIELIKYFQK